LEELVQALLLVRFPLLRCRKLFFELVALRLSMGVSELQLLSQMTAMSLKVLKLAQEQFEQSSMALECHL
jgi:hypothetical protein